MKSYHFCFSTGIFGKVCAILFLITQFGCIHKFQTITGKVVDESGVGIRNVAVIACYSGWGWSSNGLVWDKDYCSETVMTDNTGVFVISFNGPTSMRLMARKKGWIQNRDFNNKASSIVLTKLETYFKRNAARNDLREKKFQVRQIGESDEEYYCRVIMNRSGKVTLNYIGQKIIVFQNLMELEEQSLVLFAMQGSFEAASSFVNEVVLKINGTDVDRNISLRSNETTCQSDIYFLEMALSSPNSELDRRIEFLAPSIKAMFDMSIWDYQENS